MPENNLSTLITVLTGQIRTDSLKEEKSLEQVQVNIAHALLQQDPGTIRNQEFIFERSDLFAPESVQKLRLDKINALVERTRTQSPANVQVFVRNLPIRTTQAPGSTPQAAAGVRVRTSGPFIDSSGRDLWFDFVRTEKLIPLYINGWSEPAILFKASFRTTKFVLANALPVELTRKYTVVPDSVWINARVFDPSADPAFFCGLRVKGGMITLDSDPQIVNGQLTVVDTTTVQCDLQLEQNTVFASDATSPYGVDARHAEFRLPERFQFSFKGSTKKILDVADSAWSVYGQKAGFTYKGDQNSLFFPFVSRLVIPVLCDTPVFKVTTCESPFFSLQGEAKVLNSWWSIPAAKIDVLNPPEADGNGAFIVACGPGLDAANINLQYKRIALPAPFIIGEPGRIGLTELKSDGEGALQNFTLWQDEANSFGTTMEWRLLKESLLLYNSSAGGDEMLIGVTDCRMLVDRPVKVDGTAVTVKTKSSLYSLVAGKAKLQVTIIDNDVLKDNSAPGSTIPQVKPYALAMHNALFTVTPPNSVVLFGECTEDFSTVTKGKLYLGFGMFSYLPTLPDPYAANIGLLRRQFETSREAIAGVGGKRESIVWLWLIGLVQWEKKGAGKDKVGVSFHFAPLTAPFPVQKIKASSSTMVQSATDPSAYEQVAKSSPFKNLYPQAPAPAAVEVKMFNSVKQDTPVVPQVFDDSGLEDFALLDVSSKANQMGVAFSWLNNRQQIALSLQYQVDIQDESNASVFPIQMQGLDVITKGMFAHAFTVPQISWEPVFNLTPPDAAPSLPLNPPVGFNYYQSDGYATRIGNFSSEPVTLSPIPLSKFLVETYRHRKDGRTFALFNLPFGMVTFSVLNNKSTQSQHASIENVRPVFENYVNGGIQLELTAGTSPVIGEDNMFEGFTIQMMNINNPDGTPAKTTTLGHSGTIIFNSEFHDNTSGLPNRPASPVVKAGLSGYGASMFSDWHNKNAAFAQTSQALFNVVTGRTSHEVVQVKSMIYPWGVKVVRTYTMFRLANGYVCRIDSGWKAESDGKFDFSYKKPVFEADGVTVNHFDEIDNPYTFHPGVIHGIFNVKNIHEQPKEYVRPNINLVAVTFDADVQLENVVEGGKADRVATRGVVGYVQLLPQGAPLLLADFVKLMASENDSIGAEIHCSIKVAGTKQRMRLNRFDVNSAVDASGKSIFVCAARGSVVLPKDGSWTMVQHARSTGEVTPVPEELSLPLIRIGKWIKDTVVDPVSVANELLRIAFPGDILRAPGADTINFGFLQSMNTQKVLFLTPSFKPGVESLLTKTPPLLADAYRLMNGKGIFPNIGDAQSAFGTAIQLLKGVDSTKILPSPAPPPPTIEAFHQLAGVTDLGSKVWEVMSLDAKEEAGKLLDQGYKLIKSKGNDLLNDAFRFDLPNFEYPLVDVTGLKIYVEYKASKTMDGPKKDYIGKFDFDVDSFAGDMSKSWKGRMSSMAMVVDLGPLKRLVTIKGNFNSQKGAETDFGSHSDSDSGFALPAPEIEYSKDLEPVIKILEILAALSTGDYAEVLKQGMKIAMSNSANLWEYKFEATKDIPLIKFPFGALYDAPQIPLKLEASLGLGVFFNAALKVTTDPKQLLPTAGAYFKFHGGLQVMCVSVAAATVYAVGSADLTLRADTSPVISLDVKFGFGAQVGVGLPVIGNVSILFMVGVEIFVDSNQTVAVSAFILFRGHAEILGGLIGVTITIEAKGTIEKGGPPQLPANKPPTTCKAQVTFGLDISIFLIINISFSETWGEERQIA